MSDEELQQDPQISDEIEEDANQDLTEDLNQEKESEEKEEPESNKDQVLLGVLQEMKKNLDNAIEILGGGGLKSSGIKVVKDERGEAKIIEGVFSGDKMVGSDGKVYNIPPNYASKSKLVEGDIMKLTMTSAGNFIYKQIGPVPRRQVMGELIVDDERDEYWVASETDKWRILKASATYFKGQSGDKVSFLVPQEAPSKWAAVENIVKEDSGL